MNFVRFFVIIMQIVRIFLNDFGNLEKVKACNL